MRDANVPAAESVTHPSSTQAESAVCISPSALFPPMLSSHIIDSQTARAMVDGLVPKDHVDAIAALKIPKVHVPPPKMAIEEVRQQRNACESFTLSIYHLIES